MKIRIAAAVFVAALPIIAFAQNGPHHGRTGPGNVEQTQPSPAPTGQEAATQPDTPATKAYRDINARMHRDMDIRSTNDPDVDFARNMIPHHQGAVEMAKVVLQHGTDPEMRKLAEAVVATQEAEIAFIRAWLARKGY